MSKAFVRILALGLLLGSASPAGADDKPTPAATPATAITAPNSVAPDMPAAQADREDAWKDVVQLGEIKVDGDREENSRRIIAGLKVIKSGLKAKLTNDPADDNVVVCRMSYVAGSHIMTHLMCATNGTIKRYREQFSTNWEVHANAQADGAETQMLQNMAGHLDRSRYFDTKIHASELQKLLLEVPCEGCSNTGLVVGDN